MSIKNKITCVLILVLMLVLNSCVSSTNTDNESEKMNPLSNEILNKVFKNKIYFAHQSVGKNILHGIRLLAPAIEESIIEVQINDNINDLDSAFYHSRVGSNSNLKSKLDDFGTTIENTFAGNLDIAFVKLCYLEVEANTDIDGLFALYSQRIKLLQKKYPEIIFVHLTVPLKTDKSTWKTQLKKILGKNFLWEYADNISRNEYNEMLLSVYAGKEPVFDLAMIESTYPDGSRETFTFKNKTYYALVDKYSNDGSHLNDYGSKVVGAALIEYLAVI